MTASSVGLFPCRVQPIGLPPTAASNAPFNNSGNVSRSSSSSSITTNNNNNNQISRHPPMRHIRSPPTSTEVRRVSRNLFGKAERSEIDQVMRAEYERNCTYMRERYCFDIRNPPSGASSENESNSSKAKDGPLPTLIAKEVELQACKRQRKCYSKEQDSSDDLKDTEKTPTSTTTTQEQNYASLKTPTSGVSKKQISPAALENDRNSKNFAAAIEKETTSTITTITTSSETEKLSQNLSITTETVANSQQHTTTQQKQQLILCNAATSNERHKINAKQTLITDCFNVRKSATASTLQQHTKGGNLDEVLAQQRTNANVLLKVQIFKTSTPAQT